MMNRGNMGKEISTAPKSKKVKKMMMGGMAMKKKPAYGYGGMAKKKK